MDSTIKILLASIVQKIILLNLEVLSFVFAIIAISQIVKSVHVLKQSSIIAKAFDSTYLLDVQIVNIVVFVY